MYLTYIKSLKRFHLNFRCNERENKEIFILVIEIFTKTAVQKKKEKIKIKKGQ